LKKPLSTGDRIRVIDSKGRMTSATVLSCKMHEVSGIDIGGWNVTMWLSESREMKVLPLGSYATIISQYMPDLEI